MSLEKSITDTLLGYLSASGLTAISSDQLTAGQVYPALTVFVTGGKEVAQSSGVYRVRVLVEVLTDLDEPAARATHAASVESVRDLIEDEESLIAALGCYAIHDFTLDSDTRDRVSVGSIAFDIIIDSIP